MSHQAIDIEILGKVTRINCPAGQEAALLHAAQYLDQQLKEMSLRTKVTNETKLLTIVALNACYELQTLKQEKAGQQSQITERIEQLAGYLSETLNKVKKES